MNERVVKNSEMILSFGGGHGLPGFTDALHYSGRKNSKKAVVAMSDNGGATKIMRLDAHGKKVAFRDGISSILAMVHPNDRELPAYKTWVSLLTSRDETERVLGDHIVGRLFNAEDGFAQVEMDLKNCGVPLQGTVFPSSSHPSHIVYRTETSNGYTGEDMNDYNRMSLDKIIDIRLEPSVPGFPAAIEAIKEAGIIFLAPGTMHASLFSNFCPDGMRQAMKDSKAYILLITNLVGMNVDGTNNATPVELVKMVEQYTGVRPDGILIPNMSRKEFEKRYKTAAYLYWKREQAKFIGWETGGGEVRDVEREGVNVYVHNATSVVEVDNYTQVIRHNPEQLGVDIGEIIDSVLDSK